MPKLRTSPWRRDSTKPASGKPGAVHKRKEPTVPDEPKVPAEIPDPKDDTPAPYERTPEEAAAFERLYERRGTRLRPPRFNSTQEGNVARVSCDHPDRKVWTVALMEAFGVTEGVLASHLMGQVIAATARNGVVETEHVNAALATVHGIAPRDTVEGMLAAQMAATHNAAMDLMQRCASTPDIRRMETYANLATKMQRTFTTQVETLKRYRSKGEQRVVVQHQHVHVSAEQAAVQVNAGQPLPAGGMVGADSKIEGQPHAPALEDARLAPLLCANPEGHTLPVPGSPRPEAVSDARGR